MSRLDVSSGRTGIRLAVNAEAKLKALLEIGQNLGKVLTLDEVLQKILDSLFAVFIQADRGFIVLKESGTDRLVPKAVKRRREQEDDQTRISRTIIREVMARKEAILSADASTDSRFQMSESIVDFHIHSMMCAPLVTSDGDVLGAIQIDTIDPRRRFQPEDLEVLASVACQAAVAVENAELHEVALQEEVLRKELTLAHQVQRGFLPDKPPELPGYEFFDCYEPARHLGGDYFDYVPYRDGRLAVVLGDVSGKGIAAALLMAKLSAEVRYSLASESIATAAIARLNQAFCDSRWEDRFITLIAAVIDPARHEVALINAGHLLPIVRRSDGRIELVGEEEAGLPLGIAGGMAYEQTLVTLQPGDSITLYTDGIPDALNSSIEFYGMDRLKDQLVASRSGVHAMGTDLLASVKRFVGGHPQSDDMCVSCFGRVR
jgi:serine phosphatase RsbU (regulator of sigma subunit)